MRRLDFNAFSFLFVFSTRIDVSETFANSLVYFPLYMHTEYNKV